MHSNFVSCLTCIGGNQTVIACVISFFGESSNCAREEGRRGKEEGKEEEEEEEEERREMKNSPTTIDIRTFQFLYSIFG